MTDYGIAEDTGEAIDSMFKKAVGENDVVVVSGGVSVGDFDFVPAILRQNNFDLLFDKIAVKPGKPTVFGVSENKYSIISLIKRLFFTPSPPKTRALGLK